MRFIISVICTSSAYRTKWCCEGGQPVYRNSP